jgi:selenocysteine-specific translation elongation factor
VVAGIDLTGKLKVGDKIHISGHTTDMEFVVDSMQINNVNVQEARAGDSVGIKVTDRVRRGDTIYKVTD